MTEIPDLDIFAIKCRDNSKNLSAQKIFESKETKAKVRPPSNDLPCS